MTTAAVTCRVRPSATRRGYDRRWRRVRDAHLRREPRCRVCGRPAALVDHMIPFDGPTCPRRLDPGNLQSLCRRCHGGKTAAEGTVRR